MYESTPQHVIDEESHPGLLADILNSSSSSDSSSSSSDSDGSSGSHTTAKKIRRAFRGRKRRKSSASSKETPFIPSAVRTPSGSTANELGISSQPKETLGAIVSGDEADTDGEHDRIRFKPTSPTKSRDGDNEKASSGSKSPEEVRTKKKHKKKHRKSKLKIEKQVSLSEKAEIEAANTTVEPHVTPASQRVSFMQDVEIVPDSNVKRPFTLRDFAVRPTLPKMLTSTVFSAANPTGAASNTPPAAVVVPRVQIGLRRTNSLPDRLNKPQALQRVESAQHPGVVHPSSMSVHSVESNETKKYISRTSAIILLLISTGLVALCAEFLVSSINYLVDNTSVSEAFIGLIVLPIVGNAAEHVTAVTVASKNKMDLAIGVAVGSSIQIALFVTPVIVLLGWILTKDMSLYFTLFETVSLFVSVFVVNFLVLDGRSNYLEGSLLIAAYVIIAVAAFFYPDSSEQSTIGGSTAGNRF